MCVYVQYVCVSSWYAHLSAYVHIVYMIVT